MKTVRPLPVRDLIRSRISAMPRGSSPEVGSSRMRRSGSWRRACAIASRCFIPFENSWIRRPAHSPIRTSFRTSSLRARMSFLAIPRRRPAYARVSSGLRYP